MYFYELHESDSDRLSDALLVHETEFDAEQFLELVLEARGRVIDRFEEDTLLEAVAHDLERHHGFVFVDDARLTAAANVSREEGDTVAAEVGAAEDDDEDRADDGDAPFRTVLVDLDRDALN